MQTKKEFKNKSGTVASGWFSHFFSSLCPPCLSWQKHTPTKVLQLQKHMEAVMLRLWDIVCCSQTLSRNWAH